MTGTTSCIYCVVALNSYKNYEYTETLKHLRIAHHNAIRKELKKQIKQNWKNKQNRISRTNKTEFQE